MPTNTYVALDKVTVGTATAAVTFSSISSAYTDLVVVAANLVATSGNPNVGLTFNGDTASNYSATILEGTGSSAQSARKTNTTLIVEGNNVSLGGTNPSTIIYNIMNYSNTTTYKTALLRNSELSTTYPGTGATVGLWRSTAAITSVTLTIGSGNFAVGSTFSLYGIAAEGQGYATGGYVTSDSQYYYHTFTASGTFTPSRALTCDYLVVAGGGGASGYNGGGAGAGGLRSTVTATGGGGSLESALSVASGVGLTVTVGAGGNAGNNASGSAGTAGSNSVFSTITATGGGQTTSNANGSAGGSGGGGGGATGISRTGGAGTTNQGFAGGNNVTSGNYPSGGGGGASAVGNNGSGSVSGAGGNGVATSISGTSVTYAGGGGGGSTVDGATRGLGGTGGGGAGGASGSAGTAGTINTGGGGGGGAHNQNGAAGGSGIVIIRYAKV